MNQSLLEITSVCVLYQEGKNVLFLTKDEKKAIIFIAALIFIGISSKILLKKCQKMERMYFVSSDEFKLDINKAKYEDLLGIKGIGPSLADRIIEYRNLQGGFKNIEELKNIHGVGENKFCRLKDFLKADQ
jgi:competence ComEA-like helix-hairpin-helix protein